MMTEQKTATPFKQLLTTAEAADYLGIAKITLDRARTEGAIPGKFVAPPHIQLGRAIRYDRRDLDAYIEKHRRSPVPAQN